jgi:hypothetical protein
MDPARSGSSASAPMGVRMTTGGIGREPGMLIRTRVVSVVSVLGSSGCGSEAGAGNAASPGDWRFPYGGVPEGYAAPPRPWGPVDELSVSRLKAGSPGWLRRPFFQADRESEGGRVREVRRRTTILAMAGRYSKPLGMRG